MLLRPYVAETDFGEIKKWINDERTHALWCANMFRYPLEKDDFERALSDHNERFGDKPFVSTTEGGELVGFFCYSLNAANNEGMLRFVAVSPEYRGKGFGKETIRLALERAFGTSKADSVKLCVFSVNSAARKCYAGAGFTELATEENAFRFGGELWGRVVMSARRK